MQANVHNNQKKYGNGSVRLEDGGESVIWDIDRLHMHIARLVKDIAINWKSLWNELQYWTQWRNNVHAIFTAYVPPISREPSVSRFEERYLYLGIGKESREITHPQSPRLTWDYVTLAQANSTSSPVVSNLNAEFVLNLNGKQLSNLGFNGEKTSSSFLFVYTLNRAMLPDQNNTDGKFSCNVRVR